MIGDVSLVVGQPTHRVVAEMNVLECQASEPLERCELKKFLETAQPVMRKINLAKGATQGETIPYLSQPVTAQPQVF